MDATLDDEQLDDVIGRSAKADAKRELTKLLGSDARAVMVAGRIVEGILSEFNNAVAHLLSQMKGERLICSVKCL